MNIKNMVMGAVVALCGSFAMASHHIPNLDGPGALPPDAEPGQCFLHKFYPAKYEHELVQVKIKDEYTYYTVTDPVFDIETVPVVVKPDYTTYQAVPPIFDSVIERIQIKPSDPVWKVKCCDKKHRHTKACEQACLVPVKPVYKSYRYEKLIQDGSYEQVFNTQEVEEVEVEVLVEEGGVVPHEVPAEYMNVKVYTQVHPGYMKWVEGTCKKYTCNPHVLQQALKDKGFYHGSVDGIVGEQTIEALNNFRAKHDLGVHDELDLETAKMLGIEKHLVEK